MVYKLNPLKKQKKETARLIAKLKGPILIFGVGGFVGVNLIQQILLHRKDVYGVTHSKKKNWRLHGARIPQKNLISCDILESKNLKKVLEKIKPKTVFNLAAYGAYAKQTDPELIYKTNVTATVGILEILKEMKLVAYIHAGSQSEYGLNAKAPKEGDELIPNSHYAVSKVADYYLLKYYGKILSIPVIHLRLYSAYGPWEELDRLMPVLLYKAKQGTLPPFVDPSISRDFVYIDDIISALLLAAIKMKKSLFGEVFNVATGKQTTIKQLALLVKRTFLVEENPQFGTMKNRKWDVVTWYGNNKRIKKVLGWKQTVSLREGIKLTVAWQEKVGYDKLLTKYAK